MVKIDKRGRIFEYNSNENDRRAEKRTRKER